MDDDSRKYQNQPTEYKCQSCKTTFKAPIHCGHPMHIKAVQSNLEWHCWMGSDCGRKEFVANCEEPIFRISILN